MMTDEEIIKIHKSLLHHEEHEVNWIGKKYDGRERAAICLYRMAEIEGAIKEDRNWILDAVAPRCHTSAEVFKEVQRLQAIFKGRIACLEKLAAEFRRN